MKAVHLILCQRTLMQTMTRFYLHPHRIFFRIYFRDLIIIIKSPQRIRYKANICVLLELSQSLSPYYWITVAQEGLPFVLIIEHTNLVGLKNYNSHVVYLSRYLDISDPLYSASDDDIINEFADGLKRYFPV